MSIRASLSTAKFRIRAGWKSVALMVTLGAAALGMLFMAQSLSGGDPGRGAALSVTPVPPVGSVLAWTADRREASAVQAQALNDVLKLLLGVGWVALVSALVTIVSRAAAQSALRRGDVAVRRAVGASKGVLRVSLLIEVGIISLLILIGGIAIGFVATRLGIATWPGIGSAIFAPRVAFLLIALVLVMSIVLLLGANLRENISQQDEGQVPLMLPAGQLAFGLSILIGGSLVLGRAEEMTEAAGGRDGAAGSYIAIEVPDSVMKDRSQRYGALLDDLSRDSSIGTVSLTSAGAHDGLGVVDQVSTDCGQCPDGTIIVKFHNFPGVHEFVSPDTFKAQGIQIVEGRTFTRDDDWDAPRVAVVSRHLAYRHYQGGDAIGRDLFVASGWPARPYKVIGIVDDHFSHAIGGAEQPLSVVYLSVLQHPPAATELLVRGSSSPRDLDRILARDMGPSLIKQPAVSEADRARETAAPLRWLALWFGVVGWVILGIAVVGTFTILHLWVRSRGAELNLRRAVGATRVRIALFVVLRTIVVAIGGVAVGLFLFGTIVRPSLGDLFADLPVWDPTLVVRLSVLLAVTALAGSLVPTWNLLKNRSLH